jgi:hypothetical protein
MVARVQSILRGTPALKAMFARYNDNLAISDGLKPLVIAYMKSLAFLMLCQSWSSGYG